MAGFNIQTPPPGNGGATVGWLVQGLQILWRRVTGIAENGGGGTGSRYLNKQVFTPTLTRITYLAPAISPFTVGATVTGDVTLSTGKIESIDDTNGFLYLSNVSGDFDGSDLQYSDDMGGLADSDGNPGALQTNVQVENTTDILYYDPAATVSKATIGLPVAPHDGQTLYIYFGGTIHKNGIVVITTITIEAPHPTVLVADNYSVRCQVGIMVKAVYREDIDAWYITQP